MKKSLVLMLLGLCIMVSSCKNNTADSSALESTTPTADADGNIDFNVNIDGAALHGTMNKSWKREEPTKKEQRNIEQITDIFNSTNLEVNSTLFECLYGEIDGPISVWSLLYGRNEEPLDYYGIIVRSNGNDYVFPDICHGKNPVVDYNDKSGTLLIAGDVIEGTGTHVEALYVLSVNKNGEVILDKMLDPFDVQEYFKEQVNYDVADNDISLKIKNKSIAEVTNSEDGQGPIRGIAVGEQIAYEFDENHNIKVNVVPGVKFGVGSSLYYEDMPTLSADVKYDNGSFKLSNIRINEM